MYIKGSMVNSNSLLNVEDDVSKKIKNLRTQYTRERQKKKKRKTGQGADEVYVSKWPYFERLRFVDEFVAPKKSTSNLQVIHIATSILQEMYTCTSNMQAISCFLAMAQIRHQS